MHSIARSTHELIVSKHASITNNCKNLFFIEILPGLSIDS